MQQVPVMNYLNGARRGSRLTSAQQEELEMARRRAEKAAKGKAANTAAAARRVKRRKSFSSERSDDDLQHKLSTVTNDKEAKRLKRLLRNRVSAQQARERKKSYVTTLEEKCQDQEQRLAQQQQYKNTLERENVMLRSVMKNMNGANTGPSYEHHAHSSVMSDMMAEAAVPPHPPSCS